MLFDPRHGGGFTATNCSLGLLIQYAYDVMQFQISGAPGWVQSGRYDIAAKAEGDPQVSEIRAMLRQLLEDRFQLRLHWETRESAVYHLVLVRRVSFGKPDPGSALRRFPSPIRNPVGRPQMLRAEPYEILQETPKATS